jgi:hypothetical protein
LSLLTNTYACRFLAAAEELEENTTYTNADGVDCLIPAIRSSAYLDSAPHLGNGSAGPASTMSSSSNLAGQDSSESARFIERCVLDSPVVFSRR